MSKATKEGTAPTELETAVLDHLGIESPTERKSGGVHFAVATRETEIVLGLSRSCALIQLTPEEARALAANLLMAAGHSERCSKAERTSASSSSSSESRWVLDRLDRCAHRERQPWHRWLRWRRKSARTET